MWPQAWLDVAAFRKESGFERRSIEYALRRAVEEIPISKDVWLIRARYAQSVGDDATVIACFVSAVESKCQSKYTVDRLNRQPA